MEQPAVNHGSNCTCNYLASLKSEALATWPQGCFLSLFSLNFYENRTPAALVPDKIFWLAWSFYRVGWEQVYECVLSLPLHGVQSE